MKLCITCLTLILLGAAFAPLGALLLGWSTPNLDNTLLALIGSVIGLAVLSARNYASNK